MVSSDKPRLTQHHFILCFMIWEHLALWPPLLVSDFYLEMNRMKNNFFSPTEYKKTQVREGGVAHIHPQVRIKGVGFDRTLGGLEMEMRLRDHLAKIFTVS